MDLNKLFQPQKELECLIKENHNVDEDMLDKKVIGFICELYECVNEARFFKYWKRDKKPRTLKWGGRI